MFITSSLITKAYFKTKRSTQQNKSTMLEADVRGPARLEEVIIKELFIF
jgi:hypothetical protein